ncbi:MAG: hypothetical protein AB9M53_00745 [Leptothrix sp. (in: b-proteobacteria)]
MKLTKEMRTDFAEAVIEKIPMKNKMNKPKLRAAIEARAYAALPDDLKAMQKRHPLAFNENLSPGINTRRSMLEKDSGWVYPKYIITDEVKALTFKDLVAEHHAHLDELKEREDLRDNIIDRASACSTLKQLQAMFPDLTACMPRERERLLPAVIGPDTGTMAELKKAGLSIPFT